MFRVASGIAALAVACAGLLVGCAGAPASNAGPDGNVNDNGSGIPANNNSPVTTPTNENTNATVDVCDEPGVICTVAGTGMSAFDGDGRPALQTSLYYPLDVDFDLEGRPLILDWNNLRLRRINADGTVQTIMGRDFEAAPEDGALAVETPLHHSSDLDIDAEGRMLLAGNHSAVVFEVRTDQRVYVVAGSEQYGYAGDEGPAIDAALGVPFGVALDGAGGFYVSDIENHTVRHVDAAGVIRTIAGTGDPGSSDDNIPAREAQLHSPTRVRPDGLGSVYFCDTTNNRIRRVDVDGMITTVAGTGEVGYSGDGGPAVEAKLAYPYDLRFGPDGFLYIADTGNNVVRRIDADGVVTTVVGVYYDPAGKGRFEGDGGDAKSCYLYGPSSLTVGLDGSLWIADTYNNRVRRVAKFFTIPAGPGTPAE